MQNVHTRGNLARKVPLFGQFAGRLPHLDSRRGICYNFVKIRHGAGCAGRSPFSPSRWSIYPKRVSAPFVRSAAARRKPRQVFRHCSFIIYRRHEGVCFWCEHQRQTLFFLAPPFGGAGASAPERARPLQTTHIRPLRHCCAMPPLPRGEARSNGIKGGSFHENQNQFHHP